MFFFFISVVCFEQDAASSKQDVFWKRYDIMKAYLFILHSHSSADCEKRNFLSMGLFRFLFWFTFSKRKHFRFSRVTSTLKYASQHVILWGNLACGLGGTVR
jgi:hypothetical protein